MHRVSETVSIYLQKTGPGNFLPYVNLETMGHHNDPSLMSERTVGVRIDLQLCVHTKLPGTHRLYDNTKFSIQRDLHVSGY